MNRKIIASHFQDAKRQIPKPWNLWMFWTIKKPDNWDDVWMKPDWPKEDRDAFLKAATESVGFFNFSFNQGIKS